LEPCLFQNIDYSINLQDAATLPWLHQAHAHLVTKVKKWSPTPRENHVSHMVNACTTPYFFPVLHLLLYVSYLGLLFLVSLSKGRNLVCHMRLQFLSLSYISKRIFDVLSASHCALLQLYIWLDCTILRTRLS